MTIGQKITCMLLCVDQVAVFHRLISTDPSLYLYLFSWEPPQQPTSSSRNSTSLLCSHLLSPHGHVPCDMSTVHVNEIFSSFILLSSFQPSSLHLHFPIFLCTIHDPRNSCQCQNTLYVYLIIFLYCAQFNCTFWTQSLLKIPILVAIRHIYG